MKFIKPLACQRRSELVRHGSVKWKRSSLCLALRPWNDASGNNLGDCGRDDDTISQPLPLSSRPTRSRAGHEE